ncbi:MAG: Ig-like domain-containing protein [Saprospiraceae bacterium]
MNDLIESIVEHREIAIFVIGLLLIIGAITKGGISLGSFEIPKIETGQAKLLGGLGFSLILLALFLILQPEAKNNKPTASNYSKTIIKGETLTIPIMDHVEDKDETDLLKISIVDDADLGSTTMKNSNIEYIGNKVGNDLIIYQVSDGNGGRDTAKVTITVNAPPSKIVTRNGRLINIFGKPKKGIYKTDLANEKKSPAEKLITANEEGEFDIRTNEENDICKIFIAEDITDFFLKYKEDVKTVEYNPLDTIEIVFCNSYDKLERKPDSTIFKNRFKIPINQLNISIEQNGDNKTLDYGELYLAIKYYGSYSKDNKGNLDFHFIQKTGDKTVYEPVEIKSNSSPSGWRSYLKKKLLKGEYDLIIKSKNGTELERIEFELI